jgi:hypothetical protein
MAKNRNLPANFDESAVANFRDTAVHRFGITQYITDGQPDTTSVSGFQFFHFTPKKKRLEIRPMISSCAALTLTVQ